MDPRGLDVPGDPREASTRVRVRDLLVRLESFGVKDEGLDRLREELAPARTRAPAVSGREGGF